jgi:hypothetical protein
MYSLTNLLSTNPPTNPPTNPQTPDRSKEIMGQLTAYSAGGGAASRAVPIEATSPPEISLENPSTTRGVTSGAARALGLNNINIEEVRDLKTLNQGVFSGAYDPKHKQIIGKRSPPGGVSALG